MSSRIVSIYLNCLPPFLVNSIFYGYIVGYETSIKRNPIERFESMISYTTYGILFGFFYLAFFICFIFSFLLFNLVRLSSFFINDNS